MADGRLRERRQLLVNAARRRVIAEYRLRGPVAQLADVRADGERATGPGQHDAGGVANVGERVGERLLEGDRKRV